MLPRNTKIITYLGFGRITSSSNFFPCKRMVQCRCCIIRNQNGIYVRAWLSYGFSSSINIDIDSIIINNNNNNHKACVSALFACLQYSGAAVQVKLSIRKHTTTWMCRYVLFLSIMLADYQDGCYCCCCIVACCVVGDSKPCYIS